MLVFVTFSQYSGNRMLNLMLVSFLGFMMILLGNIAAYVSRAPTLTLTLRQTLPLPRPPPPRQDAERGRGCGLQAACLLAAR